MAGVAAAAGLRAGPRRARGIGGMEGGREEGKGGREGGREE